MESTGSSVWLISSQRKLAMPRSGFEREGRDSSTVERKRSVSPGRTGLRYLRTRSLCLAEGLPSSNGMPLLLSLLKYAGAYSVRILRQPDRISSEPMMPWRVESARSVEDSPAIAPGCAVQRMRWNHSRDSAAAANANSAAIAPNSALSSVSLRSSVSLVVRFL